MPSLPTCSWCWWGPLPRIHGFADSGLHREALLSERGHDCCQVFALLLDPKGFSLIVLEAKSEDKNPLVGKEQARKYAKGGLDAQGRSISVSL
jgi:hypothetical protein